MPGRSPTPAGHFLLLAACAIAISVSDQPLHHGGELVCLGSCEAGQEGLVDLLIDAGEMVERATPLGQIDANMAAIVRIMAAGQEPLVLHPADEATGARLRGTIVLGKLTNREPVAPPECRQKHPLPQRQTVLNQAPFGKLRRRLVGQAQQPPNGGQARGSAIFVVSRNHWRQHWY